MSRFFVGQRIKKVRGAYNQGVTARVMGYRSGVFADAELLIRPETPFIAEIDGVLTNGVVGQQMLTNADQWEPILPEGSAPSEFKTLHDLLNSLEGVRA